MSKTQLTAATLLPRTRAYCHVALAHVKPPPTPLPLLYRVQWFVDEGLPVWAFVGRTTKYIIDQPPLQQQGPQQQQGQQRAPAVQEGANSTQRPQVHAGEGRGGVAPSSSPGRRLLQTVGNADTTNEYNREYGSGTSRTSASSSSSSSGYYTTEYDGYGSSYEAVATRQQDVIVEANPGSTRLATKYDLFTHTVLQLSYNGLHVVEASVMSDPMHTVDITSAQRVNVTFTYEVKWQHRPGTTYMQRMDRYVQMANFVIYLEVGSSVWLSWQESGAHDRTDLDTTTGRQPHGLWARAGRV